MRILTLVSATVLLTASILTGVTLKMSMGDMTMGHANMDCLSHCVQQVTEAMPSAPVPSTFVVMLAVLAMAFVAVVREPGSSMALLGGRWSPLDRRRVLLINRRE